MQAQIITSYHPKYNSLIQRIFQMTTGDVSKSYPEYAHWFHHTFLMGLKEGMRAIVFVQNDHHEIMGCALLKKTPYERKLCSLYVQPKYRRQGVGTCLMHQSVQYLGKRPLTTVMESGLNQFRPLFNKYLFQFTSAKRLSTGIEFRFNEQQAISPKILQTRNTRQQCQA